MSTEVIVKEELSREKIDLIKQTVAKGATDLELDLFLHACKRTGLDPLMKQIYAIKRWNNAERRETISFQTGIDGYRLIADRTGKYAGSDEPTYMLSDDGLPNMASVTVYKMIEGQRCGFSASARWSEYVQKTKDGTHTSMWQKMPFLMLGKCAEALALRKAFPAELSGVYTHEEMMQADNETRPQVMDHKRNAQKAIQELRQEFAAPEAPPSFGAAAGGADTGKPVDAAPSLVDWSKVPERIMRKELAISLQDVDDPTTAYRMKLRDCTTPEAVKTWWDSVPLELRQDVWGVYTDTLKAMSVKKGK